MKAKAEDNQDQDGHEQGNGPGISTALNQLDRAIASVRAAMAERREAFSQAPPTAEQVRAVIESRQRRELIFASNFFFDPGWDLLLELYASALEYRSPTIGELTRSVKIPGSTVLRWLDTLDQQKLLTRSDDLRDSRKVRIGLSEKGKSLMERYFVESPGYLCA